MTGGKDEARRRAPCLYVSYTGEKTEAHAHGEDRTMKRFTITGEWHGSRLDRFIRASFPGTPFGVTQILLRKGLIFLNGAKASGNARLKAGDVVAVDLAEVEENGALEAGAASAALEARAGIGRDIPVIYEDDSLLVIDKPAGLVVQPGNRKEKGSLLDLLEEYRRKKSGDGRMTPPEPEFPYTPGAPPRQADERRPHRREDAATRAAGAEQGASRTARCGRSTSPSSKASRPKRTGEISHSARHAQGRAVAFDPRRRRERKPARATRS